jgi:hypothetical protein
MKNNRKYQQVQTWALKGKEPWPSAAALGFKSRILYKSTHRNYIHYKLGKKYSLKILLVIQS